MKHTIEEVELKNGARGLLIDIPAATVMDIKVQFRGGMRYAKSKEIYEIAHIVEHLSFGANASFRDEQAYEAEVLFVCLGICKVYRFVGNVVVSAQHDVESFRNK